MSLARGTRVGPYEIIELIGEGGMGQVWRARHISLHRDDALKVLPDAFTADPDRLARFDREAQILASLNHPNIAHVYGLEEVEGTRAIVMELVDGPTLADRMVHGRIPIDQALSIALQIARALEAAHDKLVIHRDLKPANVKVRPDGTVKVLDFGLAKAVDTASSGAPVVSQSPTITSPANTGQGVILGTAAYMSPEQAGGGHADRRSDIWAFGCVLYEMLTGRPPFPGDSVARVLARVLEREPDYAALPASTPPRVKRVIRRCLEKDPQKRLHHVADVRLEIEDGLADDEVSAAATPATTTRRWQVLLWAIGALVLGAAGMAGYLASMRSPVREVGPVVRSTVAALPAAEVGPRLGGLAISPDGQRIVYASAGTLLLRSLNDVDSQPLRGSENGVWPAFSPDGGSIAFFVPAESVIKRLSLGGGPSSIVANTDGGRPVGLSWGPDGTIVFATATSEGLWRVRAAGGNPDRLTMVNTAEAIAHRWPSVLPNGRGVLFEAFRGASARVGLVSLDSREVSFPVAVGGYPRFVSTGHIVYRDGRALRAVGFDPVQLVITSDNPLTVAETVEIGGDGAAAFDVSGNGSLVHVPPLEVLSTLQWVSRDGRGEPIDLPPLGYRLVQVSPDGSRIAGNIQDGDRPPEIWVSDLRRPGWSKIATPQQDGGDWYPKWTPDGQRLVFAIFGARAPGLFSAPADGTGQIEHLLTIADNSFIDPRGWSLDGRSLLFTYGNVAEPRIGSLSMQVAAEGKRSWKPLVERVGGTLAGPISTDGGWIVTESTAGGSSSIYIERFPDFGNRQRVSTEAGGRNAVWSPDGRELFYRRLTDDAMMAVRIQTVPALSIGTPTVLFESRGYRRSVATRNWDVAPDGRFLLIKEDTPVAASERPVILVQNWSTELTRAVSAK
jgi:serine/threonine-protein kinase